MKLKEVGYIFWPWMLIISGILLIIFFGVIAWQNGLECLEKYSVFHCMA